MLVYLYNQTMKKQNFQNHKRFYTPHHFILLPILAGLIFIGVRKTFTDNEHSLSWVLFTISILCILYLAIMLRQHYALGNQDRIIRLEFKLRYFELFGKRSNLIEKQLSFSQIAALRFANDDEFIILLDKALQAGMKGNDIKKSIKDWQPDNQRL